MIKIRHFLFVGLAMLLTALSGCANGGMGNPNDPLPNNAPGPVGGSGFGGGPGPL